MKIIKANTYSVVSNDPFEIPLPLKFELWYENTILVAYSISADAKVDFSFNPDANEKILTSTNRPLAMPDIYFLLSSRVFQNKQYYSEYQLSCLGLSIYNPYQIAIRTHGVLPTDMYWLRFEGETLTFRDARDAYQWLFTPKKPHAEEHDAPVTATPSTISGDKPDVSKIMKQHWVDFQKLADEEKRIESILDERGVDLSKIINDKADSVKSAESEPEPQPAVFEEFTEEPASAPASGSDKMSDDNIAALFAKFNS